MALEMDGESTFAYHGLKTTQTTHAETVKSLIHDFLEDIQFDRDLPFIKDHDLEAAVWTYFKSLNMGQKLESSVHSVLKISATLTHQAYTQLPFENKVLCTIQNLYMFLVDDIADEFMDELRCFGQNFVLNNPHNHSLLRNYDTHLRYLSRYYGPQRHSTIVKSNLDYVNGRIIEHEMEKAQFKFPPSSKLMPMFLRTKVGAAETMVSMLFPQAAYPEEEHLMRYLPVVAELIMFTDMTNDILSYYKEFVLRDEKTNFVANFAETHDMSHLDVLRHLVSYAPQLIKSIFCMLDGQQDLLDTVLTYFNGYIMMFTAHRRYHLVELFEDEGYLLPYDEDS